MKLLPKTKAGWLRVFVPLGLVAVLGGWWCLWEPGATVADGRHDLGKNGAFMAHAWIADDAWFTSSPAQLQLMTVYRDTAHAIAKLENLQKDGVRDLFPELLPCAADGALPKAGWNAAEMFAYQAAARRQRVMPWIGGTRGKDCFPERPEWRKAFAASCADLFAKCQHLSGVLVDIVPWSDGDPACLALLDDLRQALPKGKVLAVAACPPPSLLQRSPDMHWGEPYFRQVAGKCDLLVVRLHDTGMESERLYRHLVAAWTGEALAWAGGTQVLLSVADYEEKPPNPVHRPAVENLANALRGVHGGLGAKREAKDLPANYAGVALFSDATLTPEKWDVWRKEFRKAPPPAAKKPAAPEAKKPAATKQAPPPPGPWKPEQKQ